MPYLLEMKNITKTFGSVKAIDNVCLRLNAGEIVSLCGENGSGKSTLMKVLCGIYPHGSYEGEIIFAGEEIQASHIRDTERKGIAIIHQELALVKELTVLENIFLGNEITHNGIMDYDLMTLRCQKLLAQVSLSISPDTRVGDLGLGQQQLVEIAKALNKQVRLLILDEPTASLTEQETSVLLDIIRDLQQHGIACIYISHKLNEVKAISDTICVIRDGQHIGTRDAAGMSEDDIITMMVGRELTALYPNEPHTTGDEILRIEHLTAWHPVNRHIKRVNDVSFSLKRGEILGIAGLVGAGRTETMRLIFGADPKVHGKILIDGQEVHIRNPRDAIAHRIGFVTENRKEEGLFLRMPVRVNITSVAYKKILAAGTFFNFRKERKLSEEFVQKLRIVTPSVNQRVMFLSGGNQQKVVLSKWLLSDSRIVIFDEPTRGIDVGAKREIYEIINALAGEGKVVIVVSSEMEEVMGITDRILVMHEGKISGEILKKDYSQNLITEYAIGGVG